MESVNFLKNYELIDPHFHLFTNDVKRDWAQNLEMFKNFQFTIDQYQETMKDYNFTRFIHAETIADDPLEEVYFINSMKSKEPRLIGQIAGIKLQLGEEVRSYLEEIMKIKDVPVLGIRQEFMLENPDFCLQTNCIEAMKVLSNYNIPFELEGGCRQEALESIIKLVELFPSMKFVWDHAGKPDIKNDNKGIPDWYDLVVKMASFNNVTLKIGGSTFFHDMFDFDEEKLLPYLEHAFNSFGFDRVVIGSDVPMTTKCVSIDYYYNLIINVAKKCGAENKDILNMFTANIDKLYNL